MQYYNLKDFRCMAKKNKNHYLKEIMIVFLAVNYLVYWITVLCSHGDVLTKYFVFDVQNTFMDYFNPTTKVPETTYTAPSFSNYPALVNIYFYMVRNMVPSELQGYSYDMRTNMHALVLVIVFLVFNILILSSIMLRMLSKGRQVKTSDYILVCLILISGPFLFEYERGNSLLMALVFLFIFVYWHDSDCAWKRECALIMLALSAAIKLYPAFFGLLLLREKRIKEACRAVLYGLAVMFLPFFFFYDGINSMGHFLSNLFLRNSVSMVSGYGYNLSFSTFAKIMYGFFTGNVLEKVPTICYIIPILLVLAVFFTSKEKWKQTFALCLLMTWIPGNSYTYVLCFFAIPFIQFFQCEEKKHGVLYILLFTLIFCMYSFPEVGILNPDGANFPLSWGMVICAASLYAFALVIIADNIKIKKKMH